MNTPLQCTLRTSQVTYPIVIENGILQQPTRLIPFLKHRGPYAIISHDKLSYGAELYELLRKEQREAHLFTFPGGEEHKSRAVKEQLEDQLFAKGLGKDTCIIAIGGGIVTDMGGYIAATYCRGVPLISIPISLLGMVDASIGGKTGINVPYGKNMLGCIYQPKAVIIDPTTLSTLPLEELRNGAVEMIKHGLIGDAAYFHFLEKQVDPFFALDTTILEQAISESCKIKIAIVEEDEREQGKRHLLNFGHTVGHALEKMSCFSLSHGEAVAIGILAESHMAMQLGILSQQIFARIHRIFTLYKLPLRLPKPYPIEGLLEAMILDKKSLQGKPRFVLLRDIGVPYLEDETQFCTSVAEPIISNALQWMYDALYSG